jgi:hypothetical protein
MGTSTISMVSFNSYVSHYQRIIPSPYKTTIAISRTLATSSGGASVTPERQLGGFSHGQNWVCLKMGYFNGEMDAKPCFFLEIAYYIEHFMKIPTLSIQFMQGVLSFGVLEGLGICSRGMFNTT